MDTWKDFSEILILFEMGFFELSVMERRGQTPPPPPNHNFVVIALMIMKFVTGIKLDVFYTICDVTTIT